jgi:hypothetical protein
MADIYQFKLPAEKSDAELWQEMTRQIDTFVDQVFELDQLNKVSAVCYLIGAIRQRMAMDRLK